MSEAAFSGGLFRFGVRRGLAGDLGFRRELSGGGTFLISAEVVERIQFLPVRHGLSCQMTQVEYVASVTQADQYRQLGTQLRAQARRSGPARTDMERLAQCYTRLAEQADENDNLDLIYELNAKSRGDKPNPDEG